jgi:acyl-CoA synthetase (AMP-forming)/AMP-acid ligase II
VVKPADGATVDERELIEYCSERVASYKKPASVTVVDEMPRTVLGKPHKSLLRERLSTEVGVTLGISSPTSGSDSWTG